MKPRTARTRRKPTIGLRAKKSNKKGKKTTRKAYRGGFVI